jgi:GDP-L-fucose synthase
MDNFYRNKRVLVAGGTGMLGTYIANRLIAQGAKVRITVHKRPAAIKNRNAEYVKCDLTNEKDCERAVKGMDYVVLAAATVIGSGAATKNPMSAVTSNLIISARLLQAACLAKVKRVLLLSSTTTYPAFKHAVKENEVWKGPVHPSYLGVGWMKRYVEMLAKFYYEKYGMECAIVRIAPAYGRWDSFDLKMCHVIPSLIRRSVAGENPFVVWGTGNEVRDFIHADDVARGSLLALQKHYNCDAINLGSKEIVTIKQLAGLILNLTGNSKAKLIFDKSKPTAIPYRVVDVTKAARLLGFTPEISLADGLADTIDWFKKNIKH